MTVVLPDPVYAQAVRVAAEMGQSVEEFVAEAVRLHLREEPPLVLTPEQIESIRRGREDVRAGRVLTLDESKANLAGTRTA